MQCLQILIKRYPDISEPVQFWKSVNKKVETELTSSNSRGKYELRRNGEDCNGMKPQQMDPEKVQLMSHDDIQSISFPFLDKKYGREESPGDFNGSTKLFKTYFRIVFQ